jgi:hypothetical protein
LDAKLGQYALQEESKCLNLSRQLQNQQNIPACYIAVAALLHRTSAGNAWHMLHPACALTTCLSAVSICLQPAGYVLLMLVLDSALFHKIYHYMTSGSMQALRCLKHSRCHQQQQQLQLPAAFASAESIALQIGSAATYLLLARLLLLQLIPQRSQSRF